MKNISKFLSLSLFLSISSIQSMDKAAVGLTSFASTVLNSGSLSTAVLSGLTDYACASLGMIVDGENDPLDKFILLNHSQVLALQYEYNKIIYGAKFVNYVKSFSWNKSGDVCLGFSNSKRYYLSYWLNILIHSPIVNFDEYGPRPSYLK